MHRCYPRISPEGLIFRSCDQVKETPCFIVSNDGGRTRARTWDPLIKRTRVPAEISQKLNHGGDSIFGP